MSLTLLCYFKGFNQTLNKQNKKETGKFSRFNQIAGPFFHKPQIRLHLAHIEQQKKNLAKDFKLKFIASENIDRKNSVMNSWLVNIYNL